MDIAGSRDTIASKSTNLACTKCGMVLCYYRRHLSVLLHGTVIFVIAALQIHYRVYVFTNKIAPFLKHSYFQNQMSTEFANCVCVS